LVWGWALPLYVYEICGSITSDVIQQSDSSVTIAPDRIAFGNASAGSLEANQDGVVTFWLGAATVIHENVTTFTRLGLQSTPFSLNPARMAGETVVSYRED
jgi:hypothetical protein